MNLLLTVRCYAYPKCDNVFLDHKSVLLCRLQSPFPECSSPVPAGIFPTSENIGIFQIIVPVTVDVYRNGGIKDKIRVDQLPFQNATN